MTQRGMLGALLLFVALLGSEASAMPLIGGIAARDSISLDGDWMIIPDPYDQGRFDYLSRPRTDGFWLDRTSSDRTERVEYAFSREHTLRVPGDWNTQDERFFFYEGPMWYRRSFEYAPDQSLPRTFLCFEGVNGVADVWLNGERLGNGSHEPGFTPFWFEITDHLQPGANTVVVRVDNTRRPDHVPAMVTDWWNYGGITRSVRVVRTPRTFVRDAHAGLSADGKTVGGWALLDGAGAADAEVRIRVGGGPQVFTRTDETGSARFEYDAAGVRRWSPERPVLHEFRVEITGDSFTDRVGLRTIETDGGDILLNGKPVFLKGICIHEEAIAHDSAHGGRANNEAHARELLGLAKELGCNYVRLAHYPHNEWMLRVADELGLMVWAEIPVYWEMEYTNPRTLDLAKAHLREMIERDHNRASVIIWSIGNETGDRDDVTAFRTELGRYVKELDPPRLLSAAMFARQVRDDDGTLRTLVVDDPFGAVADVLAINQYVGWYHDQPEAIKGVEVELAWDKPFLISETGAGVKQGLRGEPDAIWTEEFGVRFYEHQLAWALGLEVCDGISPWILKDFLSPRRPLYGVQDWYNRKGLVSETGEKKDVFFTVQRMYQESRR